jgi:hypothetical protein
MPSCFSKEINRCLITVNDFKSPQKAYTSQSTIRLDVVHRSSAARNGSPYSIKRAERGGQVMLKPQ